MAIDELLDEHEQSRRVQEWLRRNGAGLVGGILLGLAAVGGWRWWQERQELEAMRAADAYQGAVDMVEAQGVKAAPAVNALPAGPYGSLAALELAEAQVTAGDPAAAIATLRGALPAEPALRRVVELRIGRLLLDTGKAEEALASASGDGQAVDELRGDALFALGRVEEAREAYRKALVAAEVGSPQRNLLELKYTQVGGVPASPQTP